MSSEVCPFCGKTYKRLKSHLPHCKAAASSKTPPAKQDATVNQTASSARLDKTAESTETLSVTASLKTKKSKKTSAAAATQLSSLSSASPPPSAKKKKKLPERIKEASSPSSSTASLISPSTSKPEKQSLNALIEAAKSEQGTRAASEEQHSSSAPFVAEYLTSRTAAETKTNPDSVQNNAPPAFLSTDTKPKAATRVKVKKSITTAKDASNPLHPQVDQSSESPHMGGDLWTDLECEVKDLKMGSVRGVQPRVTVRDVRATLGRAKDTRKSSRPSIMSRIQSDQNISPIPLPAEKQESCLVATTNQQQTALQPVTGNSFRSRQASLIPLQQLELTSPAPVAPLLPGTKGAGLLTIAPSLVKFSSPLLGATVEPRRAEGGSKSQLEIRTQNTTSEKAAGAPTQPSLGQVRLRELPDWLACRTPTHPKHLVEMVQRGWQWYNKRYIDVRKGGVGGLSMLLAGYCVLSYIWSYPHIKRDRWRKYH